MAEFPMPIPSWIQRDYNPAEIFLSSVKTGAAIGQSQLQLQEEQRQSDLKAQLTREEMQANLLKAQQQLAVDQAYKKQQTDMAQKQLDELKAYHANLRDKAAQDLIIRGINASANIQRAQTESERLTKTKPMQAEYDPDTGQMKMRGDADAVQAYKEAQEKAAAAQQKPAPASGWRSWLPSWLRGGSTPTMPTQPADTSGAGSTKSGLRYKIESVDESDDEE